MALTQDQLKLIQLIMYIICPISIFSNILLIITVIRSEHLHRTINYLQSSLAFAEIVTSAIWIVGNDIVTTNPRLCTVLGTTLHYSINSVSCYTVAITFYCYLAVVYGPNAAKSYHSWLHFYSLGLPALLTALLFAAETVYEKGPAIGDATYECWISPAYPELRVGLYYIPLWTHFGFMMIIYFNIFYLAKNNSAASQISNMETGIQIVDSDQDIRKSASLKSVSEPKRSSVTDRHVTINTNGKSATSSGVSRKRSKKGQSGSGGVGKKVHRKLIWRVIVLGVGFIVSWAPATATRFIAIIPGATTPYWLSLLVGVSFATSGLWNPIVFFVNLIWTKKK